ncbi:unnamed protein product [Blumeria hordei]|uniref:Cyclic nucleotide-binding domain-containing protein n=1 Tax=Blumeria hordei TaxID=2867405 RepID=A0A383V4H4_BLUHO|nr:unnamed protein product [Blumeria hordei]
MSLPPVFLSEIDSLTREVLLAKPADILQFCANYFSKRLEKERTQLLSAKPKDSAMSENTFPGRLGINPFGPESRAANTEKPSTSHIVRVTERDEDKVNPTFNNKPLKKFAGDRATNTPLQAFKLGASDGFPEHYGMGRRTSVSAESLNPTASSNESWTPPYHRKTPEQLERLKKSISGNFLFNHLDDEQSAQVLGALVEKPIPVKDIKVISQGDQGDFFLRRREGFV